MSSLIGQRLQEHILGVVERPKGQLPPVCTYAVQVPYHLGGFVLPGRS